jgi:hypothetical protein
MNAPVIQDPTLTLPQPGELLYRFEAQLSPNVVGLVPEGLRFWNPFEGVIREGFLVGARVWGNDPFVLRPDGVGIIDAPKSLSLGDLHVFEYVRGYSAPPEGLEVPPLEAFLEPGFEMPDVDFPIRGFSFFKSGHPSLETLNGSMAMIDGAANLATGALEIRTYFMGRPGSAHPFE